MANKSPHQDNAATWASLSKHWSVQQRPGYRLRAFHRTTRGELRRPDADDKDVVTAWISYSCGQIPPGTWGRLETSICHHCYFFYLLCTSWDKPDQTTITGRVNTFQSYPKASVLEINPAKWKWSVHRLYFDKVFLASVHNNQFQKSSFYFVAKCNYIIARCSI